jgi:hypothetical protein
MPARAELEHRLGPVSQRSREIAVPLFVDAPEEGLLANDPAAQGARLRIVQTLAGCQRVRQQPGQIP